MHCNDYLCKFIEGIQVGIGRNEDMNDLMKGCLARSVEIVTRPQFYSQGRSSVVGLLSTPSAC